MAGEKDTSYRAMFHSLVRRLVLVSVLPLLVIGLANFALFYALNRSIVVEQHANFLRQHKESTEAFLHNVTSQVATLAHQFTLAELLAGNLERVFRVITLQEGVLTDVGIIDSQGQHLKYVGPYDLAGKNYRDTEWFRQVVENRVHVSDVFLGFRGVPHFVIAVKREEGDGFWILRATVSTDYFSRLVDAARIGHTGETFIINRAGLYQTKTRHAGALLEPSGYPNLDPHEGIEVHRFTTGGVGYLYTTTWLTAPRWLLVFRQQLADVYSPLRTAVIVGLAMGLAGVLGGAALAVVVARAQVRRIKTADREKQALTQRLLVTGRTAAVGEMSAGLAHEINNPLATIDTLQTWICDLAEPGPINDEDRAEILDSARKIGEQVNRCKTVTQGLLKFSRKLEAKVEPVDVNQLLDEMVTVIRTRARVENVRIETDFELVPPVTASPAHLQQIFVNLVNNAIDAASGKPDGVITLRLRFRSGRVRVEVADNGCGIPAEHLASIFLPFFTTKPVGRGTGLGLAICYGLVEELEGTLAVESVPGAGTTFTVELPLRASAPAGASASVEKGRA
ncbi:MAG: ATP-binding protein [Acidobacteriota bacterium]